MSISEVAPHANIAWHLITQAERTPHEPAVTCALKPSRSGQRHYTHLTFRQLNQKSAQVALGLKRLGVKAGERAIVMVRPGPELFALTFGLFKAGVVPVLIDPGMDKRDLKACIRDASPTAFIGIGLAHAARLILGWARGQLKFTIGVGPLAWAQTSLEELFALGADAQGDYIAPEACEPDALAAVLFTSGSTGSPKGALYRQRHFAAQVELLKATYAFREGAVDVPTFPLFALFDPALGMRAVFPYMDFSAPGKADPEQIFAVIEDFGAEHMFCSPALLRRLAQALPSEPIGATSRLKTLRRVISAGAPVPPPEMRTLRAHMHEDGELFTPYGATESLPVSSISSREVDDFGEAGHQAGLGVCVGRPCPGVEVRLIEVDDEPIERWEDARHVDERGPHAVGEVVVYGPSTTQGYLARPDGDRSSKIQGPPPGVEPLSTQTVSHRMGDMGYFDQEGRLWLCGRKSHRVTWEGAWLSPLCVEGVMNTVEGVKRSALVSTPTGPALCVELDERSQRGWTEVEQALRAKRDAHPELNPIQRLLLHPGFPVDTRHNAKIKRELLSIWASAR